MVGKFVIKGVGEMMEMWQLKQMQSLPLEAKIEKTKKKNPIKKYEKQTGNKAIIGTMTDESVMREKVYLQTGCNSFDNIRPISKPISFWNEKDIWNYIKINNIPYSKI